MGIDVFTLIAQVINLIILLFLLRKFLYIPVLKAVEARQEMIASELKSAEAARKKALSAENSCRQKMEEIEEQKQDILASVRLEAENLSANLSLQAKEEYKKQQKQMKKRLLAEQNNLEKALQKMVMTNFNRFATKAMKQLADVELDDLLIHQLEQKIKALSTQKSKDYIAAFSHKPKILIETAYELTDQRRQQLQEFLHKQLNLSDTTKIIYAINPQLISGISIQAEEQLIEWSLNSYLEDFRKNIEQETLQLLTKGSK